jgi:hypothetical protein
VLKELGRFVDAFWVGLPMAVAKRMVNGTEDELRKAGWKAYDAWVNLTNEATNQLYASPATGAVTGRAMETALRAQQMGGALASALFGNLWPAVGLPTAHELTALRTEVASLRAELGQAAGDNRQAEPPVQSANVIYDDGLKLVRSGRRSRRETEEDQNAAA